MKKKTIIISIVAVLVIAIVACVGVGVYRHNHTYTLSVGEDGTISEQVMPLSGTVRVSSDGDTDVSFIEVAEDDETVNGYIAYLTPGMTEKVTLKKGYWYTVQADANITVSPVEVQIS